MKFKSTEISLQFKVWCPIFNRVKHRLFILGSLHELGAWNIYDALEAHPTPDNHTWQVDVIVPSGSSFEWVWLRTNLNRTGVEWERSTKRNRTVGYFSGVIHSIWANSEEVYLQSATFAEITTYTNVNDGYTLVLSGSTPTTGLWNLANAVQATEFPKKSGYWKVHVSFDALTNLEFQWAIVKEKDFTSVGAMEEMKHSITGRRGWMRVVAPWMVPVAGIVDIAIKNDTLDNAYGRTSILVKERQNRKEEITAWINSWNKNYAQANRQRHLKQSVSEESKTSDRTKVSDITIDPILTRQPAVRSNENLDELIQKTQERIFKESNTERFTKQLSEGYTEKCDTLKGQGQIDVPSDPINSDISNQVPLLDGGLCFYMYSKMAANNVNNTDDKSCESEVIPTQNVSSPVDILTTALTGNLAMTADSKEVEKKHWGGNADVLLTNVSMFSKTFLTQEDTPRLDSSEKPLVELTISNVNSCPSPTWSMLQEENIEVTKNPYIASRMKTKTKVKVIPMQKASYSKVETLKLFHEKNLTEAVSTSRGPFQRTVNENTSVPSAVGVDDTSKSANEIDDERSNRQIWTKLRQRLAHTSPKPPS